MRTVETSVSVEFAKRQLASGNTLMNNEVASSINMLVELCHFSAVRNFWWHDLQPSAVEDGVFEPVPQHRNFGELIALIHSEISEAMEGGRKDSNDEHLPNFLSVEVELADALIRIFDLAGAADLRLSSAFVAKMKYNAEREDHKLHNRKTVGGKQF